MGRRGVSILTPAATAGIVVLGLMQAASVQAAPADGRIIRVVYQVGGAPGAVNATWGFHLAHMRDGRYCVRFGNPGRRLTIAIIEEVADICFDGMPATVDRSRERRYQAIDTSDGKEKTFVSFSKGSIAASGNAITLDVTSCSRAKGVPEYCFANRYILRMSGQECSAEIALSRGTVPATTCEHYAAAPSPAAEDDLSKCIDDRQIYACDRIIERGNLDKMKLASILGVRSNIYESKGDLDHAIADLDEAIRLMGEVCPRCWALAFNHTMRAAYYGRKGELDRAILDYSESIRIAPKWGHNYAARAQTYAEKGDYERALADISQAIASRPDSHAFAYMYVARAMVYGKMRQPARGLPDADRAIELDPKFGEAYFVRGQLHEALGRRQEAIADFRRALALEPARTEIADELKRLEAQP